MICAIRYDRDNKVRCEVPSKVERTTEPRRLEKASRWRAETGATVNLPVRDSGRHMLPEQRNQTKPNLTNEGRKGGQSLLYGSIYSKRP